MAEFNELYRRAMYYDIVFNRDVRHEVDFITAVYQKHNDGKLPISLIDLACGPGYHAREFARRGCRAVGLDLREEMLVLAADAASQERIAVEWIAADMRQMQLSEPVDIAVNVFDGIDCLLTNDDLIAHMDTIAMNLTPGGIYMIDLTHPKFTTLNYYEAFHYSGARNGTTVEITWKGNPMQVNPLTCVAHTEVEMHVTEHRQESDFQESTFTDVAEERFLSAQEIILLARCSGKLIPVDWYGAYDLDQPFDNSPGAIRMIAILQKI